MTLAICFDMKLDSALFDTLTAQAKVNPRLRQNYDLRNSAADGSQRMLNALEPGTEVPIHRHRHSSETVAVLRGAVLNNIYDAEGNLLESYEVRPGGDVAGFSIPAGVWHRAVSLESGTVIFESKDGAWEPLSEDDVL